MQGKRPGWPPVFIEICLDSYTSLIGLPRKIHYLFFSADTPHNLRPQPWTQKSEFDHPDTVESGNKFFLKSAVDQFHYLVQISIGTR
jgi:hypothetical protein